MLPGIDAAVTEYAPDVLCVDQQAVAGGLVARRRGCGGDAVDDVAGVTDPLAGLPQVKRWLASCSRGSEREAGMPSGPPRVIDSRWPPRRASCRRTS